LHRRWHVVEQLAQPAATQSHSAGTATCLLRSE
jgi:hypothetical protein